MRRVVFFDMDGVLADFVGGALAAHGKSLPPAEVGWDFWAQVGLTAEAFWAPLADPAFWAGLEPLADGLALLDATLSAVGPARVGLLSSGLCPGSCDGKRAWLRRHLPGLERRAVFCTEKALCAAPCKLLVDDHGANVDGFVGAGGRAVLVPRPWNDRRGECDPLGRFDPERLYFDDVEPRL